MALLTQRRTPRYIRAVVRALILASVFFVVFDAAPAGASSTGAIAQETIRSHRSGSRVVSVWWLPSEYWIAAAKELELPPEQVEEVRLLYRNYTLIAVLDADVRPDGSFDSLSTAEIVRRIEISVNGSTMEVLREVDPRLQKFSPQLTYVMRASLASFGPGLRLLPLPNIGRDGVPIVRGSSGGNVRVRYKAAPGDEAEFWWHGPLTAIMGGKVCANGAPAEASWSFCPWDGKPLVAPDSP
jgi:hypothetical protein